MIADPRHVRLRLIPSTGSVLADPRFRVAVTRLGAARVKMGIQAAQDRARRGEIEPAAVAESALALLTDRPVTSRAVVNATGVILHTNLGRAALSEAAVSALSLASGSTDVELDLATGQRSLRGRGALEALARAVPSAEAVHVVNNGAAALFLTAAALAWGREIIVSRGELVEIGDGFRLPDLLQAAGARLREVGTTNRTALADYARAVGEETAFILKIHPSNFVVQGFTADTAVEALVGLGVPVVVDIGSGLLRPESLLPDEPDATTELSAGASLVTASGDKLLGGPQAGLLLGRDELIQTLRRHPLQRALRVDKLTFAALEASVDGPPTPTHEALHRTERDLRRRAEAICDTLRTRRVVCEAVPTSSVVGGGGAPGVELPSWAVAVDRHVARALREGEPPVFGRVEGPHLLLDLRAVPPASDATIVSAVAAVSSSSSS